MAYEKSIQENFHNNRQFFFSKLNSKIDIYFQSIISITSDNSYFQYINITF